MSEAQLLKQISTKTVFGDKADIQRLVLADDKKTHFLYRVLGEIEGYMIGQGKHKRVDKETGEVRDTTWTKFSGDFRAVNANGDAFEAAICFLPDYVGGPITNALDKNAGETVIIMFDIFAKYAKDSATSYEFIAQPIRSGSDESKLARLSAALPALPNAASHATALEDKSDKKKK